MIENYQHQLDVVIPAEPIRLYADPVRLVQVIENLLNNASKYTDAGGRIELTVSTEEGQAVVEVRDSGVGIEPDLLPHVFELFTQASRSLDRAQGGLGIGLTLVQRLIELHGGTVSADSEGIGCGSTFRLQLPISNQQAVAELAAIPPYNNHTRRIVVVDDNVGAAKLLTALLLKLGEHEISKAHDGPSALATVQAVRPELVLLDIGLPGMDGHEVARAIRSDRQFDDVLLVALTGYGQEEDRQKSQAAGFDLHLVKPPSVDQIREVLAHPKLTMPSNGS
jgi:CheY-like chemotaxis protein